MTLFFKKKNFNIAKVNTKIIKSCAGNIHWLVSYKTSVKNFPSLNFGEFQIQWDTHSLINDYKTVRENSENLFLSWFLFNNVFPHEKKQDTNLFKMKYLKSKT